MKMRHILMSCILGFGLMDIHASHAQDMPVENDPVLDEMEAQASGGDFIIPDARTIDAEYAAAASMLDAKGVPERPGHLMVIVDRGPQQLLMVVYPQADGGWRLIASSHISTGKPGRREHFKTPTGVFTLDGSILDYRAQGTFNENHIRGIGLKGSRVWDFGWQTTTDWRTNTDTMQIRMEMHATDPVLTRYFGHPASEGCIRIPAEMNRLIDRYGVLDEHPNESAMSGSASWKQVLGKDHHYINQAGDTMVIVDVPAPQTQTALQ